MAKRRKRRKAAGKVTIRRGSCRVVRGAVRICMGKDGKLRVSASGGRRRRKTTRRRKGRKTTRRRVTRRRVGKKLKKPKSCQSAPRMRKGKCQCVLKKSGKKKTWRVAYCRAPKRKGGRRRKKR